MSHNFRLLVDGKLVDGAKSLNVINPATGESFITVARADQDQTFTAIAAAKAAFPVWASKSYAERASYLVRFANGIEARSDEFVTMLTREQGKPLAQARFEIDLAVAQLRYHASQELKPHIIRETKGEMIVEQFYPLGVVAAIAPWNFPVWILISKVGGALMTGNTVIAKPAPTTPVTTLMLGEVASDIFPSGVFQTLVDENDLGAVLTSHPDVAFVSFTGSTITGKKVLSSAVPTLKRTSLELGGNDAAIVLDDVDIKAVARKVYSAGFLNAGQICFSAKRVYVPNSIIDAFVAELATLAREEKLGDGLDLSTTIGPVQNKAQYDKVRGYIEESRTKGSVISEGEEVPRIGYFIRPTIVTGLADDDRLVSEEQFGPVMPVLGYDDLEDAIGRANNTVFGLGATIWTSNIERGISVGSRIEAGTVWINTSLSLPFDVPFGGAKQSGIGKQGGVEGMKDYTQVRIVNAVLN